MNQLAVSTDNSTTWAIVCDSKCPVVRFLANLVRSWDRNGLFRIFGQQETSIPISESLKLALDASPWSLLLVNRQEGESYFGPEAIPHILKGLPNGRIFAVAYTLPGTMWLTRRLYQFISHNRKRFSPRASVALAQTLKVQS